MRWYYVVYILSDGSKCESCALSERAALSMASAVQRRGLRLLGMRVEGGAA